MREIYISVVMLLFTGVGFLLMNHITAQTARTFPSVVLISMLCFSVLQLLRSCLLLFGRKIPRVVSCTPFPFRRVLFAMAMLALYYNLIEPLGFYASGFLFMLAGMLIFKLRKPSRKEAAMALAISAGFTAGIYVIFNIVLAVQTPVGLFI